MNYNVTLPPRPIIRQPYLQPFHFFTAGDQLVVPIGVTHISLPLHQIQSRKREERRTNEQTLGVNSSAEGELCNIVHVQTNASVDSSETSTKLLECWLDLLSLVWTLSHADSPLCSSDRCRLPLSVVPRQLPTLSPFLSHSLTGVPSPLPVTSRSQVQNPLSGFAPKQTKESSAWRTTYIVLQQYFKRDRLKKNVIWI